MQESETNRVWQIDSVKGLFIYLVVLGHLIGGGWSFISKVIHYSIYTIHMPMFILITGILSRRTITGKKLIGNYLVPYIVFDLSYTLFQMLGGAKPQYNILVPTYSYWYILCIVIMKALHSKVDGKKLLIGSIVFAIIVVLCDVPENIWRWLSFGRVILLFPVFFIGVNLPLDKIIAFKKQKFIPAMVGFLSVGIIIILAKCGIVPLDWATHDYYSDIKTLFIKYIYMLTSVGIFIMLISFIPRWEILQQWGRNSIVVYLIHPFIVLIVRFCMNKVLIDGVFKFLAVILIALGVTTVLSLNSVYKVYSHIFYKIKTFLKMEA